MTKLSVAERIAQAKAAALAKLVETNTEPTPQAAETEPTPEPTPQAPATTEPKPSLSVAERIALLKAKQGQPAKPSQPSQQPTPIAKAVQQTIQEQSTPSIDHKRAAVTLNTEQQQAVTLAEQGHSFCLIGAAGTGKTTTVRQIVLSVLTRNKPAMFGSVALESIALVAFTNRAVSNLRIACEGIPDPSLRERAVNSCSTVHKLLNFAPIHYEIMRNGKVSTTMRFEPTFRAGNTLDHITTVIVDEASMLGLKLFKQLIEACPNATIIFIGDLNQLRPVMDDSILGYKLAELPVVELTQVYRQALQSPIVGFQHNFTLCGKNVGDSTLERISEESGGQLHFHPIKNPRTPEELARVFANAMLKHYEDGSYIPCKDIILMPNYKNFGTSLVNQYIAQELGRKRHAIVHEVRCTAHTLTGSTLRYLAVGDFVIHNKEEFFIASIDMNSRYRGRPLQDPSSHLLRNGSSTHSSAAKGAELMDFATLLDETGEERDGKDVSSHYVALIPANGCATLEEAQLVAGRTSPIMLSARKEIGDLEFGYALTIHKSQGSEWRKVFLALAIHARNLLTRELLYVGMTRAREELYIYYSPDSSTGAANNTITRCIRNQEIKGNTWREKLQAFELRFPEYQRFMSEPTQYGVNSDE